MVWKPGIEQAARWRAVAAALAGGWPVTARLRSRAVLRHRLLLPPGRRSPSPLDAYPFPTVRGGAPAQFGLALPPAPSISRQRAMIRRCPPRSPAAPRPASTGLDQPGSAPPDPVPPVPPEGRVPA